MFSKREQKGSQEHFRHNFLLNTEIKLQRSSGGNSICSSRDVLKQSKLVVKYSYLSGKRMVRVTMDLLSRPILSLRNLVG